MKSIEQLLGLDSQPMSSGQSAFRPPVSFSFLFFSDVRKDIADREKYEFTRDVTLFGDREGFTAIYLPERHFFEYGSVFANAAIVASYLIPQTERIRFRTAGISLPLHHPVEVVEAWAINDILSNGRIDLGFGSGWQIKDFVLSPGTYENRRDVCHQRIPVVQKLWRGESVNFIGPQGEEIPIRVYPRPLQPELNVWLLAVQSDAAYIYAGKQGYNVFTMLSGADLDAMGKKFALYRQAREQAGYDPQTGIISLMLHTFIHENKQTVENAIKKPFTEYIKSFLDAHVASGLGSSKGVNDIGEAEKAKMLEYAYHRYSKTAALFGTVEEAKQVVDHAIQVGVNDIACLVDFGVDYAMVKSSLPHLKKLVSAYL
ncbi:MupA/Atu3671 family FMN-dependent luciferase-like monooxygenase [Candidatus Methylobacter oryzae]|uniref:LLM class flavin-dependent oxidoreductase n=1 Tax=Candidatus Methylobacter oryzae TaxID=2497749 RepID=A0ABY3C5A6_9GAMM|nr:MupA/Atu3671 family FMN-dependent luciferase-like monooxygenase [Candidatus Methylobacter oryzae]TRW90029.1 LLM class flavin-dependent oxidoreductase [Candidatus Methylobacter oryzae]